MNRDDLIMAELRNGFLTPENSSKLTRLIDKFRFLTVLNEKQVEVCHEFTFISEGFLVEFWESIEQPGKDWN